MNKPDARVAMVTGGAQGLGRAIAERLAKNGCTLLIADVSSEQGRHTADELNAAHCSAFPFALAPSRIKTAMTVATSGGDEQYFQMGAAATSIGRLGETVDIANAVSWLCSEEAGFVTGAVIDVNCGSTMQ